jgi:all-trans-retinol dehydrogenase (NAD+)
MALFSRRVILVLLGIWLIRKLMVRARRHKLPGKVVVITGAGSGIGRLLALKFAKHGCKLALWDINEQGLQQVTAECRSELQKARPADAEALVNEAVQYWVVNVADKEAVYQAAQEVESKLQAVDILVNNAGIVTGKTFLEAE